MNTAYHIVRLLGEHHLNYVFVIMINVNLVENMMSKEILSTDNQLVIRGIDESTISKMEETLKEEKRLFVIYATAREFLDCGLEKFPQSPYLALFECLDNTDDSFIVERQQKLE